MNFTSLQNSTGIFFCCFLLIPIAFYNLAVPLKRGCISPYGLNEWDESFIHEIFARLFSFRQA